MYTVVASYYATGEGTTFMVLYTRGFGEGDGIDNAMNRFKEIFGDYYALGATVYSGMKYDIDKSKILITPWLRKSLEEWEKEYWNLEYYFSIHLNGS